MIIPFLYIKNILYLYNMFSHITHTQHNRLKTNPTQVPKRIMTDKNSIGFDDLFHHITQFVFMGELDEAEQRVLNALTLDNHAAIEKAHLLRHLAIINIKKVEYHGVKEKLQTAKNYLNEAIQILQVDYPEAARLEFQIELAKIYNLSAEFTRSQQLYNKILTKSKNTDEQIVKIKATVGIGKAAFDQGNIDIGLEYGLLAMRLLDETPNNLLLIEAYNLIGSSYLKKTTTRKCKVVFQPSIIT